MRFLVVAPSDLSLCDEEVERVVSVGVVQPARNLLLDLLHALFLVTAREEER